MSSYDTYSEYKYEYVRSSCKFTPAQVDVILVKFNYKGPSGCRDRDTGRYSDQAIEKCVLNISGDIRGTSPGLLCGYRYGSCARGCTPGCPQSTTGYINRLLRRKSVKQQTAVQQQQ